MLNDKTNESILGFIEKHKHNENKKYTKIISIKIILLKTY